MSVITKSSSSYKTAVGLLDNMVSKSAESARDVGMDDSIYVVEEVNIGNNVGLSAVADGFGFINNERKRTKDVLISVLKNAKELNAKFIEGTDEDIKLTIVFK